MNKTKHLVINIVSGLVMLALITVIPNDYVLSLIYMGIIAASLYIKKEKDDIEVLLFGFFIMTFFEYLFVMTGVETFQRNSLLGVMPLWLPLLWAFGFITIKRTINVLDGK